MTEERLSIGFDGVHVTGRRTGVNSYRSFPVIVEEHNFQKIFDPSFDHLILFCLHFGWGKLHDSHKYAPLEFPEETKKELS